MLHGRRMLEQTPVNMARYAAAFFIATTLGGAAALELKEIAKGKDPRSPKGEGRCAGARRVLGRGDAAGRRLGHLRRFPRSSQNRFGGGFASTLAGPMVQSAQNVGDATVGEGMRYARGDKTHVGRDVVKLLKQETPGSLWYSRLAFERLVADQLQEQIDPDYRRNWRTIERKAKDRGQEFWWEPGETSPERAPRLAK
jgi:hypothetical protein